MHSLYEQTSAEEVDAGRNVEAEQGTFAEFVKERVQTFAAAGGDVPRDVLVMTDPPLEHVDEYPSMWAYGNHFRCFEDTNEENTHETYGARVFVMAPQLCRTSAADTNFVLAELP